MTSMSAPSSQLIRHIRYQRELARPLDRRRQLPLVHRARARDPPRLDLPALGQERRQQPDVLVIDVVDLLRAELAHAATAEKASTRGVTALAFVLVAALAPAAASFLS